MPEHQKANTARSIPRSPQSTQQSHPATGKTIMQQSHPASIIRRAQINPASLTHADVMQLQSTIGNRAVVQLFKSSGLTNDTSKVVQKKDNRTGLPDNLKSGIENLSGLSMDDVKVHYNSSAPVRLQALAYTQGTDIYVGPGQERHLPHEAWHVVQQMQGRVRPTMQMKGVGVNDDVGLEREASEMGEMALQAKGMNSHLSYSVSAPIQRMSTTQLATPLVKDKLNVVGEYHDISNNNRGIEKLYAYFYTDSTNYWNEYEFKYSSSKNEISYGDSPLMRFATWVKFLEGRLKSLSSQKDKKAALEDLSKVKGILEQLYILMIGSEMPTNEEEKKLNYLQAYVKKVEDACNELFALIEEADDKKEAKVDTIINSNNEIKDKYEMLKEVFELLSKNSPLGNMSKDDLTKKRSNYMHEAANSDHKKLGVWKIGNRHFDDISKVYTEDKRKYNLVGAWVFYDDFKQWQEKEFVDYVLFRSAAYPNEEKYNEVNKYESFKIWAYLKKTNNSNPSEKDNKARSNKLCCAIF